MKNHACTVCGKKFRTAEGMAHHATDAHDAPRPPKPAKKGPEPIEPRCIECGKLAALVDGRVIYPHRPDLFAKWFYLCECGAYCGCHPNTTVALGYPCGPETRRARSAAHAAFDPVWKRGSLPRGQAYEWLAARFGIAPEHCHIGMMTAEQARQVPAFVNVLLTEGNRHG